MCSALGNRGRTACWLEVVRALALAVALACTGSVAAAQTAPTADDLRALQYYLDTSDTAAVDAELRRLRTRFPAWTPPADLADLRASNGGPQLDSIYRRIAAGDVAGARAAIAAAQANFPGWLPPDDMQRLLRTTEDQFNLDVALGLGNLGQALDVVRANADLLRCNRINNAWRLADLQSRTGNSAAASGTYRAVIATCPAFADVQSTLEKARAVTTDAEYAALVATVRSRFPSEGATLGEIGAGDGAGAPTATAPSPAASPRTSTARVGAAAAPTPAVTSARKASQVSTLPRSGDGRLQTVRAAAQSGNFADCAARSTRPRSIDVSYERAWCVYNLDRPLEALALFRATATAGSDATVTRDARFGMALTYTKLGMTEEAARVSASTSFTPAQRRDVEAIILDQRGVQAYQRNDHRRAIAFFDALEALQGSLRRDLAILRAYSHLAIGDHATAHAQFEALHRQLATAETRRGLDAAQE